MLDAICLGWISCLQAFWKRHEEQANVITKITIHNSYREPTIFVSSSIARWS